jgi:hypothetical protein
MAFSQTDAKQLHQVWLLGVRLHTQFGLALIIGLILGMRR